MFGLMNISSVHIASVNIQNKLNGGQMHSFLLSIYLGVKLLSLYIWSILL